MRTSNLPFVTILTPVYNGERFLTECIESVLAQSYQNWEYTIVNNCSTDRSLEIAKSYARKDPRIRVCINRSFVGVIENHNIAFSLVSPKSKYCKVISADDWITPNCLEKMVAVMEEHPTVAIIGSYQRKGDKVQWKGLSPSKEIFSGQEVCRRALIEELAIFGPPTSNMYRADLIRTREQFFPTSLPYADTCANFEYLKDHDFGFVHEVLSIERVHNERVSTKVKKLNMGDIASVEYVVKYGPIYLSEMELKNVLGQCLAGYYECLGGCVLKFKGKEFWKYHISRMQELGYPISWRKVAGATLRKLFARMRHPGVGISKLIHALKEK
jgi:glycosyltransferase involved in cell wall biosynthesis